MIYSHQTAKHTVIRYVVSSIVFFRQQLGTLQRRGSFKREDSDRDASRSEERARGSEAIGSAPGPDRGGPRAPPRAEGATRESGRAARKG